MVWSLRCWSLLLASHLFLLVYENISCKIIAPRQENLHKKTVWKDSLDNPYYEKKVLQSNDWSNVNARLRHLWLKSSSHTTTLIPRASTILSFGTDLFKFAIQMDIVDQTIILVATICQYFIRKDICVFYKFLVTYCLVY